MPTGRYALVMSDEPATARFQQPALTTTGEFVKEGALNGAILPIFIGAALAQASPNLGGLIILGGGLAAAPTGAIIGAGIGALSSLSAPSLNQVDVSTASLERAFADTRVSNTLWTQLLEAGRSDPAFSLIVDNAESARASGDTMLEIGSPQIFLIASSSREWNPELSLKVAVYVRLVRLSDGDESRVARSR